MLHSYIVMGLVMILVELVKTIEWFDTERGKLLVPVVVFFTAGLVNFLNALVFVPGSDLLSAFREGLKLGATSGGIYSMGKTYVEAYLGKEGNNE